jgi:hypothetical protein
MYYVIYEQSPENGAYNVCAKRGLRIGREWGREGREGVG